jgi:glyoxylase-like metal-dependent hydrolase (beta-lactamase superfamily II)
VPRSNVSRQSAGEQAVRLYTLDCGHLALHDMAIFSDTGEHAGEPGEMAVPCYLIQDGTRWLLWDTGLGDGPAANPAGEEILGGRWTVEHTLASQLARLGLTPKDVTYVALSHLHADHSGNVGLFESSTLLIGRSELAWAKDNPLGTDAKIVAGLTKLHLQPIDLDHDVFGDGRVRIIATPGHTPGHRALIVNLSRNGNVLLSGDLYHTRENYEKSLVPVVNTSRAETIASFDRFHRLAERLHARVIVQHAPEDFAAMPAFPGYLE